MPGAPGNKNAQKRRGPFELIAITFLGGKMAATWSAQGDGFVREEFYCQATVAAQVAGLRRIAEWIERDYASQDIPV